MFIATSFTIAKIWETQVSMDTKVDKEHVVCVCMFVCECVHTHTHMHTWEYYSGIKE